MERRIFGTTLGSLPWVAALASMCAIAALFWSGIGFSSPTTPVHFHEYSFGVLAPEVAGHVILGVAAAIFTLDAPLILLTGAESILIDADHLLGALNYPVEGRLAHSVLFAVVAAALLSYLAGKDKRLDRGVLLVTLAAVTAHLSYDVLAGNGLFPLFVPFTLGSYSFPPWAWVPLESVALLLCLIPRLGRSSLGRP